MKPWLTIKNEAGDCPVEFLIYEEIGHNWWDGSGVAAKDFAEKFNSVAPGRKINLRINSPGGAIADGLAIYNTIAKRRADVTAFVDGYALSAASFVMLAASKVVAPENAIIMIHKPQALVSGDASQMRQMADILDTHQDSIASIYIERTGKGKKSVNDALDAETWFTGKEAKEWGLVDELTAPANINNSFDLSQFKNLPAALAGNTNKTRSEPALSPDATAAVSLSGSDLVVSATGQCTQQNIKDNSMPDNTTPAPVVTTPPAAEPLAPAAAAPQVINLSPDAINAIAAAIAGIQMRNAPGVPPVGPQVTNLGNPLIEAYAAMKPGKARDAFRCANHGELLRVRREFDPKNLNTLEAALCTDYLSDAVLTVVGNRLAPLAAFTRNFGTDRMKPRASVWVPYATVGATAQSNATNFESGDTTLSGKEVDVNGISVSFHITHAAANQGYALSQLAQIQAETFANAIMDTVTAYMTAALFGAGTAVGAASNFSATDLPAIWALAKNYRKRNLLLDGGHLAYLLPVDRSSFALGETGAYGFDGIWMNNRWTDAIANTCGFVCSPDAIAIAAGLPKELPSQEFLSLGTTTVPDLGISCQTASWFSRAGRAWWASYDIMFGANEGDVTNAEVLITS